LKVGTFGVGSKIKETFVSMPSWQHKVQKVFSNWKGGQSACACQWGPSTNKQIFHAFKHKEKKPWSAFGLFQGI
jgi:hypothetical protein